MITPKPSNDKELDENKKNTGEYAPGEEPPGTGTRQHDETSHRATPVNPEAVPKDSVSDAKDRWDTESPAVKGHPQTAVPHENDEEAENSDKDDEDDDELLKKRDESGIA